MLDAQLARLFALEAPGQQAPHNIAYPPHPFFDMLEAGANEYPFVSTQLFSNAR
jgi:hypothetical protein